MGLVHAFNIAEMALGILLLFAAVILWSLFARYSSSLLAVTALLYYARTAAGLLDAYGVIDTSAVLVIMGVPLLPRALSIAVVSAFLSTLLVFIAEERKSR